ncbi:hypothetical protein M120_3795 [Bacteroides fragilis str. 3783N1-8]|nr:hypothetical protein M120_3795 [Bacteroides fragilis str. 3783N1-8]
MLTCFPEKQGSTDSKERFFAKETSHFSLLPSWLIRRKKSTSL